MLPVGPEGVSLDCLMALGGGQETPDSWDKTDFCGLFFSHTEALLVAPGEGRAYLDLLALVGQEPLGATRSELLSVPSEGKESPGLLVHTELCLLWVAGKSPCPQLCHHWMCISLLSPCWASPFPVVWLVRAGIDYFRFRPLRCPIQAI